MVGVAEKATTKSRVVQKRHRRFRSSARERMQETAEPQPEVLFEMEWGGGSVSGVSQRSHSTLPALTRHANMVRYTNTEICYPTGEHRKHMGSFFFR